MSTKIIQKGWLRLKKHFEPVKVDVYSQIPEGETMNNKKWKLET